MYDVIGETISTVHYDYDQMGQRHGRVFRAADRGRVFHDRPLRTDRPKHTHIVRFMDKTGKAIANQKVTIKDAVGKAIAEGTTNEKGVIAFKSDSIGPFSTSLEYGGQAYDRPVVFRGRDGKGGSSFPVILGGFHMGQDELVAQVPGYTRPVRPMDMDPILGLGRINMAHSLSGTPLVTTTEVVTGVLGLIGIIAGAMMDSKKSSVTSRIILSAGTALTVGTVVSAASR